jgi:hypothetical protein
VSTIGVLAVGFRAAREARAQSRARARVGRAQVSAAVILTRFATKLSQAAGSIIGLGCLVAAAWTIALPLGLLAAGLSAFVLEWRLADPEDGGPRRP